MMKMFNKMNKLGLYVFWIMFLVNLFMPFGGDIESIVLFIGVGLLVVHFIEFLVVFKKLKEIDRTSPMDFMMVMLVGLFHWLPLIKKRGE